MLRTVAFMIGSVIATQALAACPDAPQVFRPASGKFGWRIELTQASANGPGIATVQRPMSTRPAQYQVVAGQSGQTYLISSSEPDIRPFRIEGNELVFLNASRDLPSRWQLVECG